MRSDAFSEKQQEFFLNATHRWNIKTGATRSGKTFMDFFVIPKRVIRTTGSGLIVLMGNTQQTLTRNILDPMRKIWGADLVGEISSRTSVVKIFGKKCYALGADSADRVAAIQGSSIEYAYGDEVATWAEPVFNMLKSRLDKPNSTFDGTCNPDNPQHWFKKFLDSDADIYCQRYRIDDNPFLTPEFVANLKQEYAGTVYYDRYIEGLWTLAEGLIYATFSGDNLYDEAPMEVQARAHHYITMDYGTANPCVFLHILYDPYTLDVYVDREYYYDGRAKGAKSDLEYGQDLLEFMPPMPGLQVIIDPSALSFRVHMRTLGYRVKEADNDVADGIRNTSTLINLRKIKVARRCRKTIEEFGAYAWNPKAAETGKESPIKQNDHAMDALRYFVNTVVKMKRVARNQITGG